MKKKGKWLCAALLFTFAWVLLAPGHSASVQAAEQRDTKAWVRITLEGYGDCAQVDNYEYFYRRSKDKTVYRIYRRNMESWEETCIVKYKPKELIMSEFYTNGKQVVYHEEGPKGGRIFCKNVDGTGKARTIVDFRGSLHEVSAIALYGNQLYYSTYRIYDMFYKTYRVNVTGKAKKKLVSKSYAVTGNGERYFPVMNKQRNMAVFDTRTGKIRKLNKKQVVAFEQVGDYWYYATAKNPKAKTMKFTWYRRKASGKGSAKKICTFSKKGLNADNIQEICEDGIYFMGGGDKAKYYSFKSKKFKKTKRDMWYYIADTQKYM